MRRSAVVAGLCEGQCETGDREPLAREMRAHQLSDHFPRRLGHHCVAENRLP